MTRWLRLVGAKPVTLAGFVALGLCVMALQFVAVYEGLGPWLVALPLGLLSLNLASALATQPALRRGGLGVFHVGLLALMLLAGWGRLTHLNARVEVAEAAAFDATQVQVMSRGPWHDGRLASLDWHQGPLEVRYAPGLKRERTRSEVTVVSPPDSAGRRLFGDDQPLVLEGYRFYTTHNKGYAPVLSWQPHGAAPMAGAVHMPSYPLLDWQQENAWTLPDGTEARLSLAVKDALDAEGAWALGGPVREAVMTLKIGPRQWDLRPGEAAELDGAQLRFERLGLWMGYLVYYDPTLLPMLFTALLAVAGMAWHLWGRFGRLPAVPMNTPVGMPDAAAPQRAGAGSAGPAGSGGQGDRASDQVRGAARGRLASWARWSGRSGEGA
jgi:cytochrome c biogenesis protein